MHGETGIEEELEMVEERSGRDPKWRDLCQFEITSVPSYDNL